MNRIFSIWNYYLSLWAVYVVTDFMLNNNNAMTWISSSPAKSKWYLDFCGLKPINSHFEYPRKQINWGKKDRKKETKKRDLLLSVLFIYYLLDTDKPSKDYGLQMLKWMSNKRATKCLISFLPYLIPYLVSYNCWLILDIFDSKFPNWAESYWRK